MGGWVRGAGRRAGTAPHLVMAWPRGRGHDMPGCQAPLQLPPTWLLAMSLKAIRSFSSEACSRSPYSVETLVAGAPGAASVIAKSSSGLAPPAGLPSAGCAPLPCSSLRAAPEGEGAAGAGAAGWAEAAAMMVVRGDSASGSVTPSGSADSAAWVSNAGASLVRLSAQPSGWSVAGRHSTACGTEGGKRAGLMHPWTRGRRAASSSLRPPGQLCPVGTRALAHPQAAAVGAAVE